MPSFFLHLIAGLLLASVQMAHAQPSEQAGARGDYRVTMLRAAPGKWVAMRALIEGQGEAGAVNAEGRIATYRMRHSQGAPWDFLLIQPIDSLQAYFSPEVQAREAKFRVAIAELADFDEDWFVEGPAHATLKDAYPKAGAFLVEMFRARAGMQQALVDSRVKENRFLTRIDTPANFVFSGKLGADWDVMTIGFYRDFAHWGAAGSQHSAEAQDQAAREVGYGSVADLAPGLRKLLTWHQDTLASAMK